MSELIRLKAILNLRKFTESVGAWLPVQFVPVLMLLFFVPLTIIVYLISTHLHGRYFFEVLGIFYMLIFLSWIGSALTGMRLNEYLEFNSLAPYPISKPRIFFASVLGGMLDPSAISLFAPIWGISLCIAQFSHWEWIPILILLNSLFILKCIAASQVVVFFYQYALHRSKAYRFFFMVIFPILILLGGISFYGILLIATPMVDSFSSPDFNFLESTFWLSSSIFTLILKNLIEGELLQVVGYLLIYSLEFLLIIVCGGYLIRRLQCSGEEDHEQRIVGSSFSGYADSFLNRIKCIDAQVRTLILKDWKILFREPSTNSVIIIQMFSGAVFWLLAYGFAVFTVEMSQGAMAEFLDSTNNISFFKPQTVAYVWPLFYYGSLWLIGANFANNIFGRERNGINQLLLLPVSSWQILLSKNLALFIMLTIPSFAISLMASLCGLQSWHILQSLWLSFVLSLILVFLSGNFVSILFPLKIESGASQNLSRIGFGRSVLLTLTGLLTSLVGAYLSLPIFLFCVFPMLQSPAYLIPFDQQSTEQLAAGVLSILSLTPAHFYSMLYALGAYVVGLFFAEKLLNMRRDQLLAELNRSES